MRPIELAAFVSLGAIWGASFLFIKWASSPEDGFPPLTLVAMRMQLAAVIMLLYNSVLCYTDKGHREYLVYLVKERKDFFWKALTMGVLNNTIPFTLVAWSESNRYVNVGVASVIDSCIPFFSQLFGHFLLHDEQLTIRRVIGILLGFGGVLVVCLEKMIKVDEVNSADEQENKLQTLLYYVLILLATASYGLASVFGKSCMTGFSNTLAITGQIISGAIVNTVLALAIEYNYPYDAFKDQPHFIFFRHASARAFLSIAYLGLVATCGAYVFYFYLLHTIGSVKQTMVGFILPVMGIFLGVVVQHEWDGINNIYKVLQIVGALMVCGSIFLVNFKVDNKSSPTDKISQHDREQQSLLSDHSTSSDNYVSVIDSDQNTTANRVSNTNQGIYVGESTVGNGNGLEVIDSNNAARKKRRNKGYQAV